LEELGARFSDLVFQKVLSCPFVPGAERFLEKYSQTHLLFVVSGTPEPELVQIVKKRGLGRFFRGVYGSPRSKAEIVRQIVAEHGLHSSEVIFVGDALADYRAAKESGVAFIARVAANAPNPFPADLVHDPIQDLLELDRRWPNLIEKPMPKCGNQCSQPAHPETDRDRLATDRGPSDE